MVPPLPPAWRAAPRRLLHLTRALRDRALRRFPAASEGGEGALLVLAVIVGASSALGVLFFYRAISWAHLLLLTYPADWLPWAGLIVFRPVTTAAAFALAHQTMRWVGRGHDGLNVPDVQAAVEHRRARIPPRPALGRTLASAITIGGGGSAGSEGPVVVAGAALASWLGRMMRIRTDQLRVLVGCGAAAGISAAFNAPLAGAFFALEEVLGTFSGAHFSPVVVSSVVAAVVARGIFGAGPAFPVPADLGALRAIEIAVLVPLLGVACAAVAILFVRTYFRIEALAGQTRIHANAVPWLGGAAVGILVLLTGGAVAGDAHVAAPLELFGRLPWHLLLALALAKILATSLTLNTGGSGGVFTPAVFVGAAVGGAFGALVQTLLPGLGVDPALYALTGMGVMVAGATGAPITGILLVFEMTHDFALVLPLMLAVVLCLTVMRRYERDSLYSGWLRRRGSAHAATAPASAAVKPPTPH